MSGKQSKHLDAYGECFRCLEPFLVNKPDGSVSPLRLGEIVEKGSVISNGCVCPFPFPAEFVEPMTSSFECKEEKADTLELEELEPCYCGGNAQVYLGNDNYHVLCKNWNHGISSSSYPTKQMAIEQWNKKMRPVVVTETVKIELPRETAEERDLKSAISDLQNALFRTRHGEACGEQVTAAWNKLSDFMAKQAFAKIRV